ncbi:MAG: DUF11 domain-containing protein, partial [Actinomycetia bacterium]|nr:DUF11 domain-containing protein [Actinomycetes bacterium]
IPLGGTSTLTFDLTNDDAAPKSFVTFTDPLPAGMVVATPTNVTNSCGGVVTAAPGTSLITLFSGFIAGTSSCAVTVDVTTDTTGVFVNTTLEMLYSSPQISGGFATASLEVPIEFLTKVFLDDPVTPGGDVTLQFTIQNPSRTEAATDIEFTDDLSFLTDLVAVGLPLIEACDADGPGGSPGTGTLSGTTSLSFTGGSLPPEGSCTFSVTLSVDADSDSGTYTNTTSTITATIDGESVTGDPAADELTVSFAPTFTKEFLDNPVGAGGTTTLRFTITNTSAFDSLDDIAFEDVFDDVLPTASAVPSNPVCNTGTATYTPFFPVDTGIPAKLTVTGASLDPSETCTIEITLDVVTNATDGVYPNVTGPITGLLGGEEPVEGPPAADDLVVIGGPFLTKEFLGDPVIPPGTVTLQLTLTHPIPPPAPGDPPVPDITGIAFSDDLDATLDGLLATGLPVSACGGTLSTTDGGMTIDFAGGTLTAGEVCSFSVSLDVPAVAPPGPHTNTTSLLSALVDGVAVAGNPASDDLRIAGLTLTKEFLDDPVLPGETVTLEFVITNVHPTLTATAIVIRDDMETILGVSQPDITGD